MSILLTFLNKAKRHQTKNKLYLALTGSKTPTFREKRER